MKPIPREAWSYALLLIILFAIASIAVWQTIDYLGDRLPGNEFRSAAGAIWALTLGFMLIAGAFGLWATQFAAEAESRRRISRLVQAMDYIKDGLIVLDSKGRITGANPSARSMAGRAEMENQSAHTVFRCLSERDLILLTNPTQTNEVERTALLNGSLRTLRFRSQPSRSVVMVLVSDVTDMHERRARSRQAAQLQLIGEIARGVAQDFNSLLCAISGHAALIAKLSPGTPELNSSSQEITKASQRGIILAAQLIDLAKAVPPTQVSQAPGVNIRNAAEALRNMLPRNWNVESTIDGFPPLSLAGAQIEQIILNLGLLAADKLGSTGMLYIHAGTPDTADGYACTITIEATRPAREAGAQAESVPEETEGGVIQSVIRSVIKESGGTLELLRSTADTLAFRLQFPHGVSHADTMGDSGEFPSELKAYIGHWTVMLATPDRQFSLIEARLNGLNVRVQRVDGIVSVLAQVESDRHYDAIILDQNIIAQEPHGLLHAIVKLQPAVGIVVLCDDPDGQPVDLAREISFVPCKTAPDTIMLAMVEAKSIAVRRSALQG